MNESKIEGRWTEIKGEIQKTWGKVTGEELDRVKGNAKAVAGLIKEKYGEMKDDAKEKFDRIFHGTEDNNKERTH